MATKIENIIQHAVKTFKRHIRKPPEVSQTDLIHLKALVDDIDVSDVNIPKYLLRKTKISITRASADPVDYVPVYEDPDVTIGVFVVQPGAKLPLHDHPSMYGFLKVLQGVLKINSYSVLDVEQLPEKPGREFFFESPITATSHPGLVLSERDESCALTPTERNVHEVQCVRGPAAFLDILAPPYGDESMSDPKSCHYFQVVKSANLAEGLVKLMQIPCPKNFWMSPNEIEEVTV